MYVFLIAALSADGFIAKTARQKSTCWTSKADAVFFAQKTKEAGVVIMGRKTFETIGKPLPDRKTIVYTTRELTGFTSDQVEAIQLPLAELLAKLKSEGYTNVAVCGGSSLYTQFMQSGVIDTLYLTIEPVLFGTGVRLFSEEITTKIKLKKRHLLSEQVTVLEYEVVK